MPLPDRNLANQSAFIQKYFGCDPCLGWLPGVVGACCGHAGTRDGYPFLVLNDGSRLEGAEALEMMRELGGNPPDKEGSA
jgi:hypothetical protein